MDRGLSKLTVNIQPVSFWNDTATLLTIDSIQIKKFETEGFASAVWRLTKEDNKTLTSGIYEVNKDEYAAWGLDDHYILSLVAQSLGLTILPDAPPTTTEA